MSAKGCKRRTLTTRQLVLLALLLALAICLQWLEGILPPLPAPVPLHIGLANMAVMYGLFFLGGPSALLLAILKAAFALLSRGLLAGLLSLVGGLLSVGVMLLLKRCQSSYLLLSVGGALAHNAGQYLFLQLYYPSIAVVWFVPILIVFAVLTGLLTVTLLRAAIPLLQHVDKQRDGGRLGVMETTEWDKKHKREKSRKC